jgi:diguanylate cyclase (GGDEF)-like protein/PAS domain S-box-containing protein
MVPLTVPWLLGVGAIAWGWTIDPVPVVVAGLALAALVVARMMRLLRAQRENEHLYMLMAENSADATLIVSERGILLRDAPGLDTLLRSEGAGAAGVDVATLAARTVGAGQWLSEVISRVMERPGAVVERELCARVGAGEEVWLAVRVVNLLHEPYVRAVLINVHDITDRKRVERQLEHQAFHDPLTGLPNRALFRDRVEHAFDQRARSGWDPAVLFIDLDGFKAVNDRRGHGAGDQLLQAVGARLGRAVRSGDTIARLGGDEFAILVEHAQDPLRDARAVAARIEAELATPVRIGDAEIPVSVSIGIAPGTVDATPESMLRDADTAMYHAKSAGRARTVVYSGAMKRRDGVRLQVEADLPGACAAGQLRLEYQPVVALDSGRVLGFEALLRWTHPQLGELSPELFVPIAESTGAILPIGRWVLATACRQLAQWHADADPELTMAVNVSGRQLVAHDLRRDVADVLAETGIGPQRLVLEITETAIIGDMDEARTTLLDLREVGVQIAIDDFGTGYSSLSYLQQLPVDALKIDRSFMSGVRPGAELPDIVRGILDLARTLGLATIAEGVETDAQACELVRHGCEVGQGYLFSRPLPVDAATQLLSDPDVGWRAVGVGTDPSGLSV